MKVDISLMKTPIQTIEYGGFSIDIKRDDLLPFSFGGNKVRIACEYLKDMFEKNYNCLIGYGNPRSNLARALANICSKYETPCYIVSPSDDDGTFSTANNSTLVDMCNAKIKFCKKTDIKNTIENVVAECQSKGFNPYYINGNSLGQGNESVPVNAYYKVYNEINSCCEYDYFFLPLGTGMTQSGLCAGAIANNSKTKIVGISVARNKENAKIGLLNHLNSFLLDNKIKKIDIDNIYVVDDYLVGGYGQYDNNVLSVIEKMYVGQGISLDPIYTGKAFYGMIQYLIKNSINNKKVLFLHTGGELLCSLI